MRVKRALQLIVMRCDSCSLRDDYNDLKFDLKRFLEVESLRMENECVVIKFENEIVHNGTRYVTSLPFKPDHEPIPDNFDVYKHRVKSRSCQGLRKVVK